MDHLAPSSGVNWYTSYNAFGELLGGSPQVTPVELGGIDVGRSYNTQVNVQYPTQLEGLHYLQDQPSLHSSIVEEEQVSQEKPLPPQQSKTYTRIRPPVGEKIACQVCGATFACGANLRNHMRIHTGERPYACEECGASFTQRSNLRSHKRVHTGERPYMCGICGQTFARSSHLPGHMRTHTGEKPFDCPQCGRSFATNQIMKNHMRTHTGERPFVCDVCDATFAQSSCLATHKKIHTGERNFKCGKCGKAFISRSGLQTHERVHTGEKPYTCEKCDKSFKTSSYLSKHKQKYCGNNSYKNKIRQPDTGKPGLKPEGHRKLNKSRKSLKQSRRPPKKERVNGHSKKHTETESGAKLLGEPVMIQPSVQEISLGKENLIVKHDESCSFKESTCGDNFVITDTPQDEAGEENVHPTPYLQEENLSIERNGSLKQSLEDVKKYCSIIEKSKNPKQDYQQINCSKAQGLFSESHSQVLHLQEEVVRDHQLTENNFKEIKSTDFPDMYKEEMPSPPLIDVHQMCEAFPHINSIGEAPDGPPQVYASRNASTLWYS